METSASFEARSAPSPYPSDPLGLESCAATARDTAKRRQRIGGVGDRASKRCNPDADVFVMRLAAGLLGGHLMTDGRRVKQAGTGRQNDGDRGCYTNKAFQNTSDLRAAKEATSRRAARQHGSIVHNRLRVRCARKGLIRPAPSRPILSFESPPAFVRFNLVVIVKPF